MRIRKEKDPATKKLESEGIVRFQSIGQRKINKEKIKEFGRITYDFWSGVKYIVVLSALLWWIPLFGPMLAGYVGGRRTGGPKRGLIASIVALFIIGLVQYALFYGFLSTHFTNLSSYITAQVATISGHTLLEPYTEFLRYYWGEFISRITVGIPFGSNNYVLTVIFAYIGGILSLEKRKEYTDGVRSLDGVKDHLRKYAEGASRKKSAPSNTLTKRLKNLEPIKVNDSKKVDGEDKAYSCSESDQESSSKSSLDSSIFEDEPKPRSRVEHHSKSNGDDWQLL